MELTIFILVVLLVFFVGRTLFLSQDLKHERIEKMLLQLKLAYVISIFGEEGQKASKTWDSKIEEKDVD